MVSLLRLVGVSALAVISIQGGERGWNPKLAANYLDARQKDWFAWPVAQGTNGPCISCHTNLTYLMARPALRKALGEKEPTEYERGLLDALRSRASIPPGQPVMPRFSKEPLLSEAMGVEAILAAVFLPNDEAARSRMWQIGADSNKWPWFNVKLNPWEETDSGYFGAALAAGVAGNSTLREQLLRQLLRDDDRQSLHNRLTLLWSSEPSLTPDRWRRSVVDAAFRVQQPDGGWTIESLGPWVRHSERPLPAGSESYATAYAAFALTRSGLVAAADSRLARALDWLRTHQDPKLGYWDAQSMNKQYPPGSMQEGFMRDAATAFAAMALLK